MNNSPAAFGRFSGMKRALASLPVSSRYFGSGWIFLIPYLFSYLLYALANWPTGCGSSLDHSPAGNAVITLTNVFWALHLGNILIAVFLLRRWWNAKGRVDHWEVVPWIFLALFFWIPGVYLEFPADTWEHYFRITRWEELAHVREHYAWNKWSYFLAYTIVGPAGSASTLARLNLYGTAVSLLLSWQYYRLARSVGVGKRASVVFVLVQALTFGNNLFSFYRYYGISSAPIAQLAALALITLTVSVLKHPLRHALRDPSAAIGALCLIILTAYSHRQGLGIAAVGMLAATCCWVVGRGTRSTVLASAALIIANLGAVYWWPHEQALFSSLQNAGWLSAWNGFAILQPSPASARTYQILGAVGVLNAFVAIALLRKNHVIGWLTVTPLVVLSLPIFAIPIASALSAGEGSNIVTFHRLLFAVPPGLALVYLLERYFLKPALTSPRLRYSGADLTLLVTSIVLVALPSDRSCYNRLWNLVAVTPDDLSVRLTTSQSFRQQLIDPTIDHPALLVPRSIGFVLQAEGHPKLIPYYGGVRHITPPRVPATELNGFLDVLRFASERKTAMKVWMPPTTELWTPASISGFLSSHWVPQQVALDRAGKVEVDQAWREAMRKH
jgi:hypothetical protein